MTRPKLYSITLLIRGTATPVTLYFDDGNNAMIAWGMVLAEGPVLDIADAFGTIVRINRADIASHTYLDYVAIGQAQVTMEFLRRESMAALQGMEEKLREDAELQARVDAEIAKRQSH